MKFSVNDNQLFINIEGRIDSNTSNKIEEEITQLLLNNPHTSLVFNFEDVEFLSSAGLRVILRIKKKEKNFQIINVRPDVYDIFEMTGFTEMMDIQKGFRKLSVDGVEEIGRGANGIVYRYADDMIVKVYFNHAALDAIKNEIRLAKKAFISGVATAIPFDIVKVGEYYGSVFEMIKAESLSTLINENPDKLDHYIEQFVELLETMNGTIVNDESIPTIKDQAILWIDKITDYISEEEYQKLQSLFASIKEDNNMLHRDYHLKNLLMQQNELILIDMDTLSRGNVIFELTGIYNAYRGFVEVRDPDEPSFLGIDDETCYYIWDKILELYFKDRSLEERKEIEKKVSLISTVQLLKIHLKRQFSVTGDFPRKIKYLEEKLHKLIAEVEDLVVNY